MLYTDITILAHLSLESSNVFLLCFISFIYLSYFHSSYAVVCGIKVVVVEA